MAFLITTTGTLTPVVFNDLAGRSVPHPTVDLDLETFNTPEEITESDDLQTALTAGHITAKDGNGNTITDVSTVAGTTAAFAGAAAPGIVPDPVTETGKFLKDDGTWAVNGAGDMLAATYDPTAVAGDAFDADNHAYSNATSGLTATDVQAAIDEVEGRIDGLETNPVNHASRHENGGADEINVAGLSGELADPQPPKTHATSHQHSGSDEIATATPAANAIPKALGTGLLASGWIPATAPATHASTHQHGGGDEVATATPGANAIPKADGSGKLDTWVSDGSTTTKGKVELATDGEASAGVVVQGNDTRLSDARTPTSHASTHQHGGGDEVAVAAAAANAIPKALGSGVLADAWISTTSVTQHQASLSITESQISDLTHTDANAIHDNVASEINGIASKATLVAADEFVIEDSAAAFAKKKVTFSDLTDSLLPPDVMPVVSLKRTSLLSIPTVATPMTFDTAVLETDVATVKHGAVTSRIEAVVDIPACLIQFQARLNAANGGVSFDPAIEYKARLNGVTDITLQETGNHYSGSATNWEHNDCSYFALVALSAGDYVEIVIRRTTSTVETFEFITGSTFGLVALTGAKGEKGDTGAGSTVSVKDSAVLVGVFDTLNFGAGLTVTDEGSGQAKVDAAALGPATMDTVTVDTTTTAVVGAPATLLSRSFTKLGDAGSSSLKITAALSPSNDNNDRGVVAQIVVGGTRKVDGASSGKTTDYRHNTVTLVWIETGLAAGAHTVDLDWYVESDTGRCRPVTRQDESATLIVEEIPA